MWPESDRGRGAGAEQLVDKNRIFRIFLLIWNIFISEKFNCDIDEPHKQWVKSKIFELKKYGKRVNILEAIITRETLTHAPRTFENFFL